MRRDLFVVVVSKNRSVEEGSSFSFFLCLSLKNLGGEFFLDDKWETEKRKICIFSQKIVRRKTAERERRRRETFDERENGREEERVRETDVCLSLFF